MRAAGQLIALALALSMSPGAVELVEDGMHWLLADHSDHGAHADACPEHGCTPASHHCSCCTSIAMATAPSVVVSVRAEAARARFVFDVDTRGPRGVCRSIDRPPAA